MTEKSLRKGSPAPGPVPEGLIRLYSMRFCPFSQRTRMVLLAKGIKCEIVNINLKSKPEWFLKKVPLGLVPVLETTKGEIICESLITCDYLDEAYPGKKLTPSDPIRKAQQEMLLEHFSKLVSLVYRIVYARKKGENTTAMKVELNAMVFELEAVLVKTKTPYFGGDCVSMLDYMLWPWFERLEMYSIQDCLNNTPKLNCWVAAMMQDPAVKATITDVEVLKVILELYMADSIDAADYGLK